MRKRKGITLEMVAGVILAVIGVGVLISMSSGMLGGSFNDLYCSAYQGVTFLISGGSTSIPPPRQCRPKGERCETKILNTREEEKVSMKIVSSILECWDQYRGYGNVSKCCGGYNIKKMEGEIKESEINNILVDQDFCPENIHNSKLEHGSGFTCGSRNEINFEKEKIKKDYIVIKFVNESVVVR